MMNTGRKDTMIKEATTTATEGTEGLTEAMISMGTTFIMATSLIMVTDMTTDKVIDQFDTAKDMATDSEVAMDQADSFTGTIILVHTTPFTALTMCIPVGTDQADTAMGMD